ncbi:MAG: S8 family serine peptidase [Methanosarcinaceae archaeon]
MMKNKIYSILVLFFVMAELTSASALFSYDNDKTGIDQIMPNDLTKDISINIDPFLAAEMKEKQDEKIPVLIEMKKQQKGSFDASKAKSVAIESQSALAASLGSMQAENVKQHWIVNMISAKVAAHDIDDIAARPDVKKVWLDREIKLIEPKSAMSSPDYGDGQIGAPQVWSIGYNGNGMKIAILDTGIDSTHPDLDGGKVVAENDFTDDSTTDDLNGHGTHCAGIAAGKLNSITSISGVAPGASLINAKVLNKIGTGYISWIINGIEWSMDQDADILSMSLGGWQMDGTASDPLCLAVTNAVNDGYVVVIAAVNAGPGDSTIGSPAVAYGAIAVAASDINNEIMRWSSKGPTGDGRVGIDVAAPGYNIISTSAGWETGDNTNNNYTVKSGTSMACPHVAGAAALLLEAYPDLTPKEVEGVLMNAADDVGYGIPEQGAGRLNVTAAYHALANGTLVNDPQWFVGRVHQGNYTNTFTAYNQNDSAVDVNITGSSGDAGDWITLDTANLSVLANGANTFSVTMNVTNTVPGIYSGSITVSDGRSNITIPISVNVMLMLENTTIDHITGYVDDDSGSGKFFPEGDWAYYTLDVKNGITNLNLSLNWKDPDNDLDIYLFDPNAGLIGESFTRDVPEVISVDNPSIGIWTVAIRAYELATTDESYNLTIDTTGENIGKITDITVTPLDVESFDNLTFGVNFMNTGTGSITTNGTIDVYHIGEYGRILEDELPISLKSANAGESINWIIEWTASLMTGNYEATAMLYYDDEVITEKTESFNVIDKTLPISNHPAGVEFTENTTANFTHWNLSDWHPGYYRVLRNGTQIVSETPWDDRENITVLVDTNIGTGDFNYTIQYNDSSNNYGIPDTVIITITKDIIQPYASGEIPANGSFVSNTTPLISVNITDNASGVDVSSIVMTVDGNIVDVTSTSTSTSMPGSYTVSNLTTALFTHAQIVNITVNATDNNSNPMNYNWSFNIDNVTPTINITSPLDGDSTTESSIIVRGCVNGTGSTPMVIVNGIEAPITLTNFSGTFTANIPLSPNTNIIHASVTDAAGNSNTTSIKVTRTSSQSSGGGGGGGGSSGETYANIEFKDAARVYINKDSQISFTFDEPENDILYVKYKALTNAGYISTVIEVLKDTSVFAKEAPYGTVYRNGNIWVGKSGYATGKNIEDPVVGFKVKKKWIKDNDIEDNSIKLNRYHEDTWTALFTAKTGENATYVYFESKTPGFSPFAITGYKKSIPIQTPTPAASSEEINKEQNKVLTTASPEETNKEQNEVPTTTTTPVPEVEAPPPKTISWWVSFLIVALIILVVAGVYMYLRKQQS